MHKRTDLSRLGRTALVLALAMLPQSAVAAGHRIHGPMPLGVPVEFLLFGATLLGIALLHRHALAVAVTGLAALLVYQALVSGFPTGFGAAALALHLEHEWVTFANLLLLLVGFELLSNQFEKSNLPDHMPDLLPDNWSGGLVLLGVVFLMSMFLDNIASAVLGGVMARHAYKGRVCIAFLAAIVAAANAGGTGSVIGDTTTTLLWLHGISPVAVLPAYLAAVPAFVVFGIAGALVQHRHQPILAHNLPDRPLEWRRIWVVAAILAAAVAANVFATILGAAETAPWLGIALWAALLATSFVARPDWKVAIGGMRSAIFLVALVAAASLMPVKSLPDPSSHTVFALGALSAAFDNIPLTMLALKQGGYDWGLLAYAVGFGGSMLWFGSSAGVALSTMFPEARFTLRWLREAWFIPLAYVFGFAVLLASAGWNPEAS